MSHAIASSSCFDTGYWHRSFRAPGTYTRHCDANLALMSFCILAGTSVAGTSSMEHWPTRRLRVLCVLTELASSYWGLLLLLVLHFPRFGSTFSVKPQDTLKRLGWAYQTIWLSILARIMRVPSVEDGVIMILPRNNHRSKDSRPLSLVRKPSMFGCRPP